MYCPLLKIDQGQWSIVTLSDAADGALSVVVPAGIWFAAEMPSKCGFALVSCVVAPGFEFSAFELASKGSLPQSFAQHRDFIERLCRLD